MSAPESAALRSDRTTTTVPEPTFTYDGGPVDRRLLEAALDFLISIEPDPESDADYQKILEDQAASITAADTVIRKFGEQIRPPTVETMRDTFYKIVRSKKYQGSVVACSVTYAKLSRGWRGINGWQDYG